MPAEYRFLNYTPPGSSAYVAHYYRTNPAHAGTSRSWLFEATGDAKDAAPRLLRHLRQSGQWTMRPARNGMYVFRNSSHNGLIALFFKKDKDGRQMTSTHMVRVNSEWHKPNAWERSLSHLPESWLRELSD
jgi:hypothetical protein